MDLITSHKDKLAYFRIKELKDVLTHLGLSKQGKKQDLIDRILAILSDERVPGMWPKKNDVAKEQVAKLVDDTYRKMQATGASDLASKSQGISDSTNVMVKEESEDSYQKQKIRCPCGSSSPTNAMIKCEDSRCNVWQHITCVIIAEKPVEGTPPIPPEIFYCEICRLNRADPFWVTVAHPLYPVKLIIINVPTDGSNPGQTIEKTFQISRPERDMLLKHDYDVQAWCMLVNDKVTFRMQWPQYADLQVNGVPVRAINRPGSQLLGANGRDDGPVITPCTRDGINKISLTGCDSRIFCLGVRIVKRRTLQQVLNMIPKETEGECFEDALARVRRCVGGGAATENADSDSDIEVVADFIPVSLRCPMSGLRMKVAGRFKPCVHMGCFDLEVFVEMNQRSRKWQCPICLKNYTLEKIIIDPYFNRITTKLQNFGEDLAEIEVKPDGSWRAKSENGRRGLGELGLWHFPAGTICPSVDAESKQKQELKPIKQEVSADSPAGLKLGIKKNQNGLWVFNKPGDLQGVLPANTFEENLKSNCENVIPMSRSGTAGSGKYCEDVSVNQDLRGSIDFSAVNGIEYESISMNMEPTHGFTGQISSVTPGDAEVIVLSDSDEEIEPLISSGAVYNQSEPDVAGVPFPLSQHEIPNPYFESPGLGNCGSSCLDIYGTNDDDFGNMWSTSSGIQGDSGFQLFGSNAGGSDAMFDRHRGSIDCSPSISGYTPTADAAIGSAALESTAQLSNMNDSLVDNHMTYSGNDPSLQIFLPTRPSDESDVHSDFRDHPDVQSGVRTEDWISLRLGDSEGVGQGESAAVNGLNLGKRLQSKDCASNSLADTASLLLGMNNRPGKTSGEGPGNPFLFPRQRRSVRPRLHMSIDSASE